MWGAEASAGWESSLTLVPVTHQEQSNLRGFIWLTLLGGNSSVRESRIARRTGTEAETMEEPCLLACSLSHTAQAHLSRDVLPTGGGPSYVN